MRIISQSGMIDLPYEQVGISIGAVSYNMIVAYPASVKNKDSGYWTMAKYSTPEKAKKAMEMLKRYYISKYIFSVDVDDGRRAAIEVMDIAEIAKQAVFQFPQDEEIEV